MTALVRLVVPVAVLILASAAETSARQRYVELYDEGVQHVRRGEWKEAESKLQLAIKEGPSNRRRAIRRQGMLFDDFMPEYYLGVVYVATNKPKDALAMFDRARAAKIDTGSSEFRQIAAYEQKAKGALALVAANPPGGGVKPTPPTTEKPGPTEKPAPPVNPNPPPPVTPTPAEPKVEPKVETPASQKVDTGALVARVEDALKRRDATLARNEFNALMREAPSAPATTGLSVRVFQLEREVQIEKIEDALKRRDATLARRELNVFAKDFGAAQALAGLTTRVVQLERALQIEEIARRRDAISARRELNAFAKAFPNAPDLKGLTVVVSQLERELSAGHYRDAMTAYFSGNYRQALDSLGLAEKVVSLTARGHFYRACSLAAQAATTGEDANTDPRIREARQSYQRAAKLAPAEFKPDLQYISPRILRLVGAS
jgi:tetratricopeptide (TPR) repeat protein